MGERTVSYLSRAGQAYVEKSSSVLTATPETPTATRIVENFLRRIATSL
jgi:hypothetical protein